MIAIARSAPLATCSVVVNLGEVRISRQPQEILVAYGLGSCVGVGMYDPVARVGGLLHAVLAECPGDGEAPATQFVDSGLAWLLAELRKEGACPERLVVSLVGGANMLASAPCLAQQLNIGQRNVETARTYLAKLNLKICGQAVGGTDGRTMRLYLADGRTTVRVAGGAERVIVNANLDSANLRDQGVIQHGNHIDCR